MKRFLKFTASVTWHVVKNVGGFILVMALFIGAVYGIGWVVGNAVVYWSPIEEPPTENTTVFGMLCLMAIAYVIAGIVGAVRAAKWLRSKWQETT